MDKTSFEHLFWKVIHNKFLFQTILEHIENYKLAGNLFFNSGNNELEAREEGEFEEFNNQDYYFNIKKIKFKNITSLSFIVEKKLWNLLLDKIKSNYHIEIDNLLIFLENCKDEEIIELLFNKYQDQFIVLDVINLSIQASNIVALDFYLSTNQFQIHPITILNTIKFKSDKEIESLLNLDSIDYKKICQFNEFVLSDCLNIILDNSNIKNKDNIILLLFNHPNLFSTFSTTHTHTTNLNSNSNKKMKFSNNNNNKIKETSHIKYEINEIELKKLLIEITDLEIKFKLMDLLLIKKSTILEFTKLVSISSGGSGVNVDTLLFYINVLFRLCSIDYDFIPDEISLKINSLLKDRDQDNLENEKEIEKQLKLILVLNSNSSKFYYEYLIDYDDINSIITSTSSNQKQQQNEDNEDNEEGSSSNSLIDLNKIILNYTFSVFSVNGLKYLIEKKIKQVIPINNNIKVQKLINIIIENQSRLIEFFKIFNSQSNLSTTSTTSTSTTTVSLLKPYVWLKLNETTLHSLISNSGGKINKNQFLEINNKIRFAGGGGNIDFKIIKWYIENILKSIFTNGNLEKIYQYTKFKLHFKEKQEIDYFIKNFKLFNIELESNNVSYESIELIDYFSKSIISNNTKAAVPPPIPKTILYKNDFIKSIEFCNIKLFNQCILKSKSKLQNNNQPKFMYTNSLNNSNNNTLNFNNSCSINQILKLFNHLISPSINGFNYFSKQLKLVFLNYKNRNNLTFLGKLFDGLKNDGNQAIEEMKELNKIDDIKLLDKSSLEIIIMIFMSFLIYREFKVIKEFSGLITSIINQCDDDQFLKSIIIDEEYFEDVEFYCSDTLDNNNNSLVYPYDPLINSIDIYNLIKLFSKIYKNGCSGGQSESESQEIISDVWKVIFKRLFNLFLSTIPPSPSSDDSSSSIITLPNVLELFTFFKNVLECNKDSISKNQDYYMTRYLFGLKNLKLFNFIKFYEIKNKSNNKLPLDQLNEIYEISNKCSINETFNELFQLTININNNQEGARGKAYSNLFQFYLKTYDFDSFLMQLENKNMDGGGVDVVKITTKVLNLFIILVESVQLLNRLIQLNLFTIKRIIQVCLKFGKFDFIQFIFNNFDIVQIYGEMMNQREEHILDLSYQSKSRMDSISLKYIFDNHMDSIQPSIYNNNKLYESLLFNSIYSRDFQIFKSLINQFPKLSFESSLSQFVYAYTTPHSIYYIGKLLLYLYKLPNLNQQQINLINKLIKAVEDYDKGNRFNFNFYK